MALIEWRNEFSVGIPSVDHEHRELIAMINELHASMAKPGADVTVMDFLGEIYAKIAAHFALEEKLMRERGYDQYQSHKQDHERLLDEIRDIMDAYEDDASFDDEMLTARLAPWFTEHFKTHDAQFHKHVVQSQGAH